MTDPVHATRSTTITDYSLVVRRHKRLIVAIVAIFVFGSLAYSLQQSKSYTAQATVLFQDPNEALALTGTVGDAFLSSAQLGQIGADTIISPRLLSTVKRDLGTSLTTSQLKQQLTTSADPTTSQVTIQGEGSTGRFAAALANAAANVGSTLQAGIQRGRYASAARRLQAEEQALPNTPGSASQRAVYADQISRLRALSTLTSPVEVTAPAVVPQSPSSPAPVKDAILFGILGLIVALIAAVVRESFDRRVRSTSDIEEELGLPVLGHIGEDALGKAGYSTHGRGALADEDVEAFRILRTHVRFVNAERPPKIVLVTSPMPQEGKSTVAASLAYSYAMAGRTTLLLECDFRRPSLAERLGVNAQPGLIDYLAGGCGPAEVVQVVPDGPAAPVVNGAAAKGAAPKPQLMAIVAGERASGQPAELFETPAFLDFLAEVSEVYDAVVIDTAPLLPVADTLEIVGRADAVLMCVRASQTTHSQAAAGKAALESVRERLAGIVVTGVSVQERGYYGYYGYYGYGDRPDRSATPA